MDKNEFTAWYSAWFALHPFKRDRDWQDLGPVHYEAFGKENPQMMREALGQLTEEIRHFPTPSDIRNKLRSLSSGKTEQRSGGRKTSETETQATRLAEHLLGVEYDGVRVKRPSGIPMWAQDIVHRAIENKPDDCPGNVLLARVGLAIAQGEG